LFRVVSDGLFGYSSISTSPQTKLQGETKVKTKGKKDWNEGR